MDYIDCMITKGHSLLGLEENFLRIKKIGIQYNSHLVFSINFFEPIGDIITGNLFIKA